MKKLFSFLSVLSLIIVANANPKMEFGHYTGVDMESGTLEADLILNTNYTLVLKLKSSEFEVPEPGCVGPYVEVANDLLSQVSCPLDFLPTASLKLDISKVNATSVRSADGAEVLVYVDALGQDPIPFKMKIVE